MYNVFKAIYARYAKNNYYPLYKVDNKVKVYISDAEIKTMYIEVLDEELGKRLYDVLKTLKWENENIVTRNAFFHVGTFEAKKKVVVWYTLHFDGHYIPQVRNRIHSLYEPIDESEWPKGVEPDTLDSKLRLQQMGNFFVAMDRQMYILKDLEIDSSKCNCISDLLSYMVKREHGPKEIWQRSRRCFVKCVVEKLLNSQEFLTLKENLDKNILIDYTALKKHFLLARLYVHYKKNQEISDDDILEAVENFYPNYYYDDGISKENAQDYIIAIDNNFDSVYEKTEETVEYDIYDNNIKIFKYIEHIGDIAKLLYPKIKVPKIKNEQPKKTIIDWYGNVLGYTFETDNRKYSSIWHYEGKDIRDICSFCQEVWNSNYCKIGLLIYTSDDDGRHFAYYSIEYYCDGNNNSEERYEDCAMLFFELVENYLKKKYGEKLCAKQVWKEREIRLLAPVISAQLVKYLFNKREASSLFEPNSSVKLVDYLVKLKLTTFEADDNTNPMNQPYIFDFEFEEEYNMPFTSGITKELPNGAKFVSGWDRQIAEKSLKNTRFIHTVGISKKVFSSSKLDGSGMFLLEGVVTEPLCGERLTKEYLLNLNNKELYRLLGHLYIKGKYDFGKTNDRYVPFKYLRVNKESYEFYIDWTDCEDIVVFEDFNSIIEELLKMGYTHNAFLDIYSFCAKLDRCVLNENDETVWTAQIEKYINTLDTYCEQHRIYYNSNEGCPGCERQNYIVPQNYESEFKLIYEDRVAKHYSINSWYNLKIYKEDLKNLSLIEKSVIEAAEDTSRVMHIKKYDNSYVEPNLLKQDLFKPYQKAIDAEKKFIGCVYPAVQFEKSEEAKELCIDIGDLQKLNNLARIKCLIRLILQVNEITSQGLGFIENPFGNVFLNKNHKKQVQIANFEFIRQGNIENTKMWTYNYVCSVLESDSSISIDVSDCANAIEKLLKKLHYYAQKLTKYCTIHKQYYSQEQLCCPKCCNIENQLETIKIRYVNPNKYVDKEYFDEGGESLIYSYSKNLVAKIFKVEEIDYNLKIATIIKILGKKDIIKSINAQKHDYKYVIPNTILVDKSKNELLGYIMHKVKDSFPISNLRDKEVIKELGFTKKDVLEILITIGQGIEMLHRYNIFIGDLNGRNILFNSQKKVYFIDFDGVGVDDISPEFCTEGYIDPISKKNHTITMKDDWYSFAIQAFYYLTYTHPFNGIYTEKLEDGKEVEVDIVQKMERKISLLGNHNITPPTIAEDWEWMSDELKKAFLDIFEGESRQSIVPILINQYKILKKLETSNSNVSKTQESIIRINSKLLCISKKCLESGKVIDVYDDYLAVTQEKLQNSNTLDKYHSIKYQLDTSKECYYITRLTEPMPIFDLSELIQKGYGKIKNIHLSEDENMIFIVYNNLIVVKELLSLDRTITIDISSETNIVIDDNVIYSIGKHDGKKVIIKRPVTLNEELKEEYIKLDCGSIKWFNVKFDSKYVLIKRINSQNTDEVYCNSQKFCDIKFISQNSKYKISYDSSSKSWLVLNTDGIGCVINNNGTGTPIDISQEVQNCKLLKSFYRNKRIYIPKADCLFIVNVNNQSQNKVLECHGIMTPDTKICEVSKDGIKFITNGILYSICKE